MINFLSKKTTFVNAAFTLAEVLIVLGILGIVAEMVIPTLITNVEKEKYKSSFKKTYSIIAQVAIQNDNDGSTTITDLYNYLNVSKICTGTETDCIPTAYRSATSDVYSAPTIKAGPTIWGAVDGGARLSDGSSIKIFKGNTGSLLTFTCGSVSNNYTFSHNTSLARYAIFIDVNGLKMPNKIGTDAFLVILVDNKVLRPLGTGCDATGVGCDYDILTNASN